MTGPGPIQQPQHADEMAFYRDYLSPIFARHLGIEYHWCDRWYEHPEAREVVKQLWLSWEALFPDTQGIAVWLVSFGYPLMNQLLNPSGTFAKCTVTEKGEGPGRHNPPEPLPLPVD